MEEYGIYKYKVSVSTNCGNVRNQNEDNFYVNGTTRAISNTFLDYNTIVNDELIAAVCDGMGGETNGELASHIAVTTAQDLSIGLKTCNADEINNVIHDYVNKTNNQICEMLKNNNSSRGGSTFALVYIRNDVVYPFSLGDSRIYIYRHGRLHQISEDHTMAMRKLKAKIYTKEEADKSMDSHRLTLFLGVDFSGIGLNAEIYNPFRFEPTDKILICSDGLYDMCTNKEIKKVLASDVESPAITLKNMALSHGGVDNITCIVIESTEKSNKNSYGIINRIKSIFKKDLV